MSAVCHLIEALLSLDPSAVAADVPLGKIQQLQGHVSEIMACASASSTVYQDIGALPRGGPQRRRVGKQSGGSQQLFCNHFEWMFRGQFPELLLMVIDALPCRGALKMFNVCPAIGKVAKGNAHGQGTKYLYKVEIPATALTGDVLPGAAASDGFFSLLGQRKFAALSDASLELDCDLKGPVQSTNASRSYLALQHLSVKCQKGHKLFSKMSTAMCASMPSLRSLHLHMCPNIGSGMFRVLAKSCPLLEDLWLVQCTYPDYQCASLDLRELSGLSLRELRVDDHNYRNLWVMQELSSCGRIAVGHYRSDTDVVFGALKDTLERLSIRGLMRKKLLPQCVARFVEHSSTITHIRCDLPPQTKQRCLNAKPALLISSDGDAWHSECSSLGGGH